MAAAAAVGALPLACRTIGVPAAPPRIRVGYAAITWGGDDNKAMEEIAATGYKGIQLRASVLKLYANRPKALRDVLQRRGLTFAVLSSGNLVGDPAVERDQLALHREHAEFVRDAGGTFLQVIDERPKRPLTSADYTRMGQLLTKLGRETAAAGVPLVYHHHMNSTGEKPEEIEAILQAADPAYVGLLFDIAHYQQGGGDPVAGIRTYRKWIKAVHLKDVKTVPGAPGYRFVELGRGRVDVKGAVAALREGGFSGWAIVELDQPSAPDTPKSAALANRRYVESQLDLKIG
jgi:inosose dehydratase